MEKVLDKELQDVLKGDTSWDELMNNEEFSDLESDIFNCEYDKIDEMVDKWCREND